MKERPIADVAAFVDDAIENPRPPSARTRAMFTRAMFASNERSPSSYLNPSGPLVVRAFSCRKETVDVVSGRVFVTAHCTWPAHGCRYQLQGHDPGDEDRK